MLGSVPCHNPVQLASWGRGGKCHVGFCSMNMEINARDLPTSELVSQLCHNFVRYPILPPTIHLKWKMLVLTEVNWRLIRHPIVKSLF